MSAQGERGPQISKLCHIPMCILIFLYAGRCFQQRDGKEGRPRKTMFCFTNTLGIGKSHTVDLAKEDFKRRETRQSCGIINCDKIKIKQR